jgi:hypothetical protein
MVHEIHPSGCIVEGASSSPQDHGETTRKPHKELDDPRIQTRIWGSRLARYPVVVGNRAAPGTTLSHGQGHGS